MATLPEEKMRNFEEKIGYQFQNHNLLITALTHSSYANECRIKTLNNERLEFLGDSVLNLSVSNYLYNRFKNLTEGELTKLRASIVSEASLAKIARKLELGDYLRLGKGEENTGGRDRDSILADAVEALIGAVYLDGGFEKASDFILRYQIPEIDKSLEGKGFRDYKTELQELIQRDSEQEIKYSIIKESGPDHAKQFVAQVSHNQKVIGEGIGKSKKDAEQQAARQALEKIHGGPF